MILVLFLMNKAMEVKQKLSSNERTSPHQNMNVLLIANQKITWINLVIILYCSSTVSVQVTSWSHALLNRRGDGAEGVGGWCGQSGVWPIVQHFLPGCCHCSRSGHW